MVVGVEKVNVSVELVVEEVVVVGVEVVERVVDHLVRLVMVVIGAVVVRGVVVHVFWVVEAALVGALDVRAVVGIVVGGGSLGVMVDLRSAVSKRGYVKAHIL